MNQIHSSDYPVTCLNWFNDYIYISTTKDVQYYNMAERNPGRRHIDEKEFVMKNLYIASFHIIETKNAQKYKKISHERAVHQDALQ